MSFHSNITTHIPSPLALLLLLLHARSLGRHRFTARHNVRLAKGTQLAAQQHTVSARLRGECIMTSHANTTALAAACDKGRWGKRGRGPGRGCVQLESGRDECHMRGAEVVRCKVRANQVYGAFIS